MPDWKKEIKLSDLLKRDKAEQRATESAPSESGPAPGSADPAAGQPSFWKREFKLSDVMKRGQKPVSSAPAAQPPADAPQWSPASQDEPAQQAAPAAEAPASQPASAQAQQPAPPVPHVTAPAPPPADQPPFEQPQAGAPSAETQAAAAPGADPQAAPPPVAGPTAGVQPPAQQPQQPSAAPTAVAPSAEESSVWKREVKASDLLKKMGWSGSGGPQAPQGKASEKRTPRPDGPSSDSPAGGGDGGASVWKKELKASDLFRRREKAPAVPGDAFSEAGSEPVSFWKKEISLTDLIRKPGAEDGSPAPAAPSGSTKKGAKKLGKPSLAKLGGSFGKGKSPRASSANTPIAVPLTRAVNLLPPDLAPQKKSAVGPAEIGVGVAAVAVLAGLFILYNGASGEVDEATQRLDTVVAEQEALAQSAQELEASVGVGSVTSPLIGEEGERASALSNALQTRTAWDRVLRNITVVMPAETWLRGLGGTSTTSDVALSAGGAELVSTLTLTGFSISRDGVAKLLSRMEAIPELATVQLLAATQTTLRGESVVEFSITATLEENLPAAAAPSLADTIGDTP